MSQPLELDVNIEESGKGKQTRRREELGPWDNVGHQNLPEADNMLACGVPTTGLTLFSYIEPQNITRRGVHFTDKGSEAQGH